METAARIGVSNAMHRFEVCVQHDGHSIYRTYGSLDGAAAYARDYTGSKILFTDEDKARGFGRDMGKSTLLYRTYPDGRREVWKTFLPATDEGGTVREKDSKEYQEHCHAQAERNKAATERAAREVAQKYAAREDDIDKMAKSIAEAFKGSIGELVTALQEQNSAGAGATTTKSGK